MGVMLSAKNERRNFDHGSLLVNCRSGSAFGSIDSSLVPPPNCVKFQHFGIDVSRKVANSLMEACGKAIKQFYFTYWASHGTFILSRKSYVRIVEYFVRERGKSGFYHTLPHWSYLDLLADLYAFESLFRSLHPAGKVNARKDFRSDSGLRSGMMGANGVHPTVQWQRPCL